MSLISENVGEAVAPEGGAVLVEYQDIKLRAKKIRVDYSAKTVFAEGDVVLEQGKSRITGSVLDFDLQTKTGILQTGTVDLEGGFHLTSGLLAKVGPQTYTVSNGTVTACEGENPAWEFRFKSGRIRLEEYARMKGVVYRMGGVPLLYTPYIVWPAMRERASGFMIPAIGYSSDRGGFLGLSYFWAMSRSTDTTFLAELYTKKFTGLGMELRARPSGGTQFEGNFFLVRDWDEATWGWKTRGRLVSDDLAPGLRGVASWLNFSDLDFFQAYERDFALASTRSIKMDGFLTYSRDPYSLNLRLDREKALFGSGDVVLSRQPVLEARMRPTPLLGQTVLLEAEGQAGFLNQDRGPDQPQGTYDRLDLYPRVSIPLSFVPWLSIQADAGGRFTTYGKSLSADKKTLVGDRYSRVVGTAGVSLAGPSFAKIFETKLGPYTRMKHILEPRLDYAYASDPSDAERTPQFDQVDFLRSLHTLKYALVQRLLAKQEKGSATEVASLEIAQTHYFESLYADGAAPPGTDPKKSPVETTLRVNATNKVSFDARASYETKARQITSASVSANLNFGERNAMLSLYQNRPVGSPSSAQVRLLGGLPVIPKRLRLDVQGNYDLSESKLLELRTLLTLQTSCYKILFEYRDLRMGAVPSRDFRIGLSLKNIGSFLDFPVSMP